MAVNARTKLFCQLLIKHLDAENWGDIEPVWLRYISGEYPLSDLEENEDVDALHSVSGLAAVVDVTLEELFADLGGDENDRGAGDLYATETIDETQLPHNDSAFHLDLRDAFLAGCRHVRALDQAERDALTIALTNLCRAVGLDVEAAKLLADGPPDLTDEEIAFGRALLYVELAVEDEVTQTTQMDTPMTSDFEPRKGSKLEQTGDRRTVRVWTIDFGTEAERDNAAAHLRVTDSPQLATTEEGS